MRNLHLPVKFGDIGKHRQFIYGFAALWIMFYHMGTSVPAIGIWKPLWFFQSTGAGGVEVFLLLTGMGLYSSMKRDARLGSFYGKRLLRVFLPAFIFFAVINVTSNQRLIGYLGSLTFFSHWLGAGTAWYVAFILTMYLMYPLLFALTNKKRGLLWVGAVLIWGASFVLEGMSHGPNDEMMRMISRIPIFLVGCAAAPWFYENRKLPKWILPVSIVVTVPLMGLFLKMADAGYLYTFRALAYFTYSIALVLVLSWIAELFARKWWLHGIYRFFAFCGGISLEIYIIFSRLKGLLTRLPGFHAHACGELKLDIASAICTIILSVTLQCIVEGIIKRFSNVRIPTPEDQR